MLSLKTQINRKKSKRREHKWNIISDKLVSLQLISIYIQLLVNLAHLLNQNIFELFFYAPSELSNFGNSFKQLNTNVEELFALVCSMISF